MIRHIFLLIFILFIFCITSNCIANELALTKSQITPREISKIIQKQGPKQTIKLLYANQKTWDMVLRNIASGKQEWLNVAKLLKSGTDAGSSEMLNLAMGEALAYSPKFVLEIMKEDNFFTAVCYGPDLDDIRFSTYDKAINATNFRIAVLEKVNDSNLMDIRNKCIDNLKKSKISLQEYFNVKK